MNHGGQYAQQAVVSRVCQVGPEWPYFVIPVIHIHQIEPLSLFRDFIANLAYQWLHPPLRLHEVTCITSGTVATMICYVEVYEFTLSLNAKNRLYFFLYPVYCTVLSMFCGRIPRKESVCSMEHMLFRYFAIECTCNLVVCCVHVIECKGLVCVFWKTFPNRYNVALVLHTCISCRNFHWWCWHKQLKCKRDLTATCFQIWVMHSSLCSLSYPLTSVPRSYFSSLPMYNQNYNVWGNVSFNSEMSGNFWH